MATKPYYLLHHINTCSLFNLPHLGASHPRWLSGLMRSRVHSLWLLVDHCVVRNWDRILVRAVKGLISRAGMVSICPLLWQRDVKLQQTNTHLGAKISLVKVIITRTSISIALITLHIDQWQLFYRFVHIIGLSQCKGGGGGGLSNSLKK